MINHKKFQIGLAGVLLAVLTISGNPALAAGFEKSVLWSGKWTALGGAAASSVSGPDALYFNPAGLGGSTGLQINLNGERSMTLPNFYSHLPASLATESLAISP
jgi:hypothetical protein